MDNSIDTIVNGIVADLKRDGFSDEDIEMAVATARKHYEAFLGKPKKSKKEDCEDVES